MTAKKFVYLLIAALVGGFIYVGWKLTSRDAYESAEYSVLETEGNIELRSYPELMLATTNMKLESQGNDGSFGRLFQYISGGNADNQKIAMTTPVFMEPESDQTNGQMSFVIPKKVSQAQIPEPANNKVRLTKRPAGKFAVIQFAGSLDQDLLKEQQAKLEAWIQKKGYVPVGEAETAGYDPPWTPGPFRRNEILIRIDPNEAE